jgi:hypothetical protein
MMGAFTIACRARLVDGCYHGTPTRRQFDANLPMDEDNTWDGETIVCDPCYIAIMPFTRSGQALAEEIPEAIETYRESLEFLRETDDIDAAIAQAEGWVAKHTPGYPAHRSASACLAMARAERQRREKETA